MRFSAAAAVMTAAAALLLTGLIWLLLIGPESGSAKHASGQAERAPDTTFTAQTQTPSPSLAMPPGAAASTVDADADTRTRACREYRALLGGQVLLVGISNASLDTLAQPLPGPAWSRDEMRELLTLNLGIERIFARGLTQFFQGGARLNSDPYAYLSRQELESRVRAGDIDAHHRLGAQQIGALFTRTEGLDNTVWPEYRAALSVLEHAARAGNTEALIDLLQVVERAPHTARANFSTLDPAALEQLQTDFYRWHLYATGHPDLTIRLLAHFSMEDIEQYKDERFRKLFSTTARQSPGVLAAQSTLADLPRTDAADLARTLHLKNRLGNAEQALEILTQLESACPDKSN